LFAVLVEKKSQDHLFATMVHPKEIQCTHHNQSLLPNHRCKTISITPKNLISAIAEKKSTISLGRSPLHQVQHQNEYNNNECKAIITTS